MLALSAGVAGCSSPAPGLDVRDLPVEYSADTSAHPELLPHCNGSNLVEHYGQVVSAKSFQHVNGLDWVSLVVLKADDDRLWDAAVQAVENCAGSVDAGVAGEVAVASVVEVVPADGPNIGDDTQWFEVSVGATSTVLGSSDVLRDRDVLVRSGDYVIQLRSNVLSESERVALVRSALDE